MNSDDRKTRIKGTRLKGIGELDLNPPSTAY